MLTHSVRCQHVSRQLFVSSSTSLLVQTRGYASQPKKGQIVKQACKSSSKSTSYRLKLMWTTAQGFKGKRNAHPGQIEPAKKDKKMVRLRRPWNIQHGRLWFIRPFH